MPITRIVRAIYRFALFRKKFKFLGVLHIPLRRSKRARRPIISDDYIVYLHENEYDVGDVLYSTTSKEAIVSPQFNF